MEVFILTTIATVIGLHVSLLFSLLIIFFRTKIRKKMARWPTALSSRLIFLSKPVAPWAIITGHSKPNLGDMQMQTNPPATELNLIEKIATFYHARTGIEKDELWGEAAIGYCQATATFDPSNGAKLTTWAWACIHNQVKTFVKNEMFWKSRSIPTEHEILAKIPTAAPTNGNRNNEIDAEKILTMLASLNTKDYITLTDYYLNGLTLAQIGAKCRRKPQTIRMRREKALRRLRKRLGVK